MKCLALAVACAAAVAGLTACSQNIAPSPSHTSASAAVPTNPETTIAHSARSVNCSQQYNTWNNGRGKGLVAALRAVSSADTTGDVQVLMVTLNEAKPAIARAARYQMPACADPKGYWDALLMHVNAAANTKTISSLRAAMKGVSKIDGELMAELNRVNTPA
jgi:hypothetical protein